MKIEIERKFLLKALPNKEPDQSVEIDQYYLKNKSGIWERTRSWKSTNSEIKYIHTIKKSLSKSVNMEDEHFITEKEFIDFKNLCLDQKSESKYIRKVRHIYNEGNLFWEVDEFKANYHLIIAELEIPKKSYKITIPDYINDVLLIEVTGLKQFSNRSLSIKI